MNITRAEAAAIKAQLGRIVVQKAPGDLLAIFVNGKLANPLNGTPWIWKKRTRYARGWKDRVLTAILEADIAYSLAATGWTEFCAARKEIHFQANTWNAMDSDGLQAAMKPIRDALVEAKIISDDAEHEGHSFTYSQKIDRARRGVEIHVRLR